MQISIDWLSFNALATPLTKIADCELFKVVKQSYNTPQFKSVFIAYINGEETFTLCSEPSTPILNPNLIQIKLHNKVLYTLDSINVINNICESLNIVFQNISRLDICTDITTFLNGYSLDKFIFAVRTKNIIKKQRGECTITFDTAYDSKAHYIRFGKKSSDICFYCYDKKKEMNDKKLKPWIIDKWKIQNIDTEQEIIRVEFSIKNTKKLLIDKGNGEIFPLHQTSILEPNNIRLLFDVLSTKYFDFRFYDTKGRIDRLGKIHLLDTNKTDFTLTDCTTELESNKMQKYQISQLLKHYHYLRTHKATTVESLKRSAYTLAEVYALQDYATQKDKDIEQAL